MIPKRASGRGGWRPPFGVTGGVVGVDGVCPSVWAGARRGWALMLARRRGLESAMGLHWLQDAARFLAGF